MRQIWYKVHVLCSLRAQNEDGTGAVYVAACHGQLGVLKELEAVSGYK